MISFDSVINNFNKNYPLYENNFKNLILTNNKLKTCTYILISIIIVLVIYIVRNHLNKQNPNQV